MKRRVYLDWNATTPLRDVARAAMVRAMDVLGNPSSVHGEGRAAKGLIEDARAQVAAAFGVGGHDVIWTSGATEAAALALAGRGLTCSPFEHDAVAAWCALGDTPGVQQWANSETGVIYPVAEGTEFCDMTQAFGKLPVGFDWAGVQMACASAHKLGGPKGVGCLMVRRGVDIDPVLKGGGQEMGRRAGTENVIGIAGFAAAATQAAKDLADGVWAPVAKRRDMLIAALEASGKPIIFVGMDQDRLPNTVCFAAPSWKADTQVMQMDLAGFAISAGAACSSGKVKESRVLRAMGYDAKVAQSAVRVSLGPTTTQDDVMRFADTWCAAYGRFLARAVAA